MPFRAKPKSWGKMGQWVTSFFLQNPQKRPQLSQSMEGIRNVKHFFRPKTSKPMFNFRGSKKVPQNVIFRIAHPTLVTKGTGLKFRTSNFRHFLGHFFTRARKCHFSAHVFSSFLGVEKTTSTRFQTMCRERACLNRCFSILEMPYRSFCRKMTFSCTNF